jgi:hypothetical protein
MIKFFYKEKWSEFDLGCDSPRDSGRRYAISTFGRLVSFIENIKEGTILKGSKTGGYNCFRYRLYVEKEIISGHKLLHRLVAEEFIPKENEEQAFVIHLDFDKQNNHVSNLRWVTKAEMHAHGQKSPAVIQAISNMVEHIRSGQRFKLNAPKVLYIRGKLDDPERKTRMRLLAKQFGVSEMQLYRIKRRENWGHLKD